MPKAKIVDAPDKQSMRDRIVEFKRIKASELMENDGNWRLHPIVQVDAMAGILKEIGIADSLLAYHSERNGGKLTLIDGHLRKSVDPDQEWPVQITDLNDKEADLLLTVLDPLAGLAEMSAVKMMALQETVSTDEWAVREVLRKLAAQASEALKDEADEKQPKDVSGPDAMELLPFEHYDYVLVMFKNQLDFGKAIELLGLERQHDPRRTPKIGLSRVYSGKKFLSIMEQAGVMAPIGTVGQVQDENSHTE